MAVQTIDFLNDGYELHTLLPLQLNVLVPWQIGGFQPYTNEPTVLPRMYGEFDSANDTREQIDSMSLYSNAFSIFVFFHYICS
jgi:hypothetical protein